MAVLHQSLLRGKLPRGLHWADAVELIGHLGEVEAQGGEEFAFVVGTKRELFKRPHEPEFGIAEVSRLRRFLKGAGAESPTIAHVPPRQMVVVIDHHAARIFGDLAAAEDAPRQTAAIEPYDPHHFHHHLIHRKEAHYQGDRVPEDNTFYEEVAAALMPADTIVLIGHGTGKSSAVDVLIEYLKKHHIDISRRVEAHETVDLPALTEPEIISLAKRHMREPI